MRLPTLLGLLTLVLVVHLFPSASAKALSARHCIPWGPGCDMCQVVSCDRCGGVDCFARVCSGKEIQYVCPPG